MSKHGWKIGAVLTAATSVVIWASMASRPRPAETLPQVVGLNNTVLFMATGNHGLTNSLYATIQGLLEHQPHIQIHFAAADDGTPSHVGAVEGLEKKLASIVSYARRRTPSAGDVVYHRLPALSFDAAADRNNVTDLSWFGPPNRRGANQLGQQVQKVLSGWTTQEYIDLYEASAALIGAVDPALVVLDTFMLPSVDAARMGKRLYAFVTPQTLADTFAHMQPWGKVLWKFPVMGVDTGFPMEWRHVPENVAVAARLLWDLAHMPLVKQQRADLVAYGIDEPLDFLYQHKPHVPWISMSTDGASVPIDYIPANVTSTGPLVLDSAPAAEQDPELAAWLGRRRTVMINLGTVLKNWTPYQAQTMGAAVRTAMEKHPDVQVLWKMRNVAHRRAELEKHLSQYLADGRVRVVSWLKPDVFSILNTGQVIAYVNHGGSNAYHEAVAAGVPQVLLPMWVDCYNYAGIVEGLDIGVYGSRRTAPDWTVEELTDSLLAVVDDERAKSMRATTARLGQKYREKTGREIAAAEVARWAATGRSAEAQPAGE